jgi:hypothetical protein
MNELGLTATFLRDLLTNDATVFALVGDRIHRNRVPPNSGLPCIVFSLIGSVDKNAIGADQRLFTRPLYLVKAVTEGTDDTMGDAIATAIDNALMGKSDFTGSGGLVKLGCFREELVEYPEEVNGVQYNHIGGRYRLFVHSA